MGSNYPYNPFQSAKEIRLLVLEPGSYEDVLIASLVHVDLENDPEYEAISYCWTSCVQYEGGEHDTNPSLPVGITKQDESDASRLATKAAHLSYMEVLDHAQPDSYSFYYMSVGKRPQGRLVCDGQTVEIGGELCSALKRFRKEDSQRSLWADAICINQADLDEKAIQIANMDEIYSRASRVLIWLGKDHQNIYWGVPTLAVLYCKLKALADCSEDGSEAHFQLPFVADDETRTAYWNQVVELLRRAWFSRIWCLQEVAKAQEAALYVSDLAIPWQFFGYLIADLRGNNLDTDLFTTKGWLGIGPINTMWDLYRHKSPVPILRLLAETRHFKSTLPCDKIFALIGLVSEEERRMVTIDYRASHESIYKELALAQIRSNNALDVLYECCKHRQSSVLNLPSWVPDWTLPQWHASFSLKGFKSKASLDTKPNYCIRPCQNKLAVGGRIVDEILLFDDVRTIPKPGLEADLIPNQKWLPKVQYKVPPLVSSIWGDPGIRESKHHYHSRARLNRIRLWLENTIRNVAFPTSIATPAEFEMLWRTFICDQLPGSGKPGEEYSEYFSVWMAFHMIDFNSSSLEDVEAQIAALANKSKRLDLRELPDKFTPWERLSKKMNQVATPNGTWCYNRRLFRSREGRLGWCPDGIEIGDRIVILDGLNVPLVLREVAEGFEVCGDCYLYGVMDGEAMSMDYQEQMFELV